MNIKSHLQNFHVKAAEHHNDISLFHKAMAEHHEEHEEDSRAKAHWQACKSHNGMAEMHLKAAKTIADDVDPVTGASATLPPVTPETRVGSSYFRAAAVPTNVSALAPESPHTLASRGLRHVPRPGAPSIEEVAGFGTITGDDLTDEILRKSLGID